MSRYATIALRSAFAGAAIFALASAASAQGIDLGGHDFGAPVGVAADEVTGALKTKDLTYSGNVIVSQGNFKLHSDVVRVYDKKGKIDRIVATGHVLFDAPSGTASGTKGIYELAARRITLSGNVVLTKGQSVMRGTQLVMDLNSGKAKLTARGTSGGRVQGLFTPPPKHKTPKDNGKK